MGINKDRPYFKEDDIVWYDNRGEKNIFKCVFLGYDFFGRAASVRIIKEYEGAPDSRAVGVCEAVNIDHLHKDKKSCYEQYIKKSEALIEERRELISLYKKDIYEFKKKITSDKKIIEGL